MSKKQKSAFHNSDLGRSKPKRHFIKTFVDSNLKQPRRLHSDTGLVVDRTSPATVIRVILGLIVLHLVIIGGVMARGSIAKSNSGLAIAPTITPPPAAPAQVAPAPAPVQPVINTQPAAPAAPAPADSQVHITQAPVNMEAVTPAPAQPEAPVQPVAVHVTENSHALGGALPTVGSAERGKILFCFHAAPILLSYFQINITCIWW